MVDTKPLTVRLWIGKAPHGYKGEEAPTLTVHRPASGARPSAAVIICPGGGYGALMDRYEGHDVAKWLNKAGIAGLVLRYRINCCHPGPLADAQRALRTTRAHAREWNIDPARIGIMGFSAGGHVASTAGTHFDVGDPSADDTVERQSARPDFMVLIYPVISMGEPSHRGSRLTLLGQNPAQELVESLSNEKQVTAQTPPTFLVHARTDQLVPVANSALFYEALQSNNVPAEFMELPEGQHGLGCGKGALWEAWQARCLEWLTARGLTGK